MNEEERRVPMPSDFIDAKLEQAVVAGFAASPDRLFAGAVDPVKFATPKAGLVCNALIDVCSQSRGEFEENIARVSAFLSKEGTKSFDVGEYLSLGRAMPHANAPKVGYGEVCQLHARRGVLAKMKEAAASLRTGTVSDALNKLRQAMEEAEEKGSVDVMDAGYMHQFAMAMTMKGASGKRVPTGITAIDREIGFVSPGDLVVIGADTGVGKSSTMLMCALEQIKNHNLKVGIVSCEDSSMTWGGRLNAMQTGMSSQHMRIHGISRSQFEMDVVPAMEKSRNLELYTAFAIAGSEVSVSTAMERLVREHQCDVIMVDYIQAMCISKSTHSRKEDIRYICGKLKSKASDLGVPLYLASQLTRPKQDDRAKGRMPTKYDLKECGDLENMAEVIILLHKKPDDHNTVFGVMAKSKFGGDDTQFTLYRGENGCLKEFIPKQGSDRGKEWDF